MRLMLLLERGVVAMERLATAAETLAVNLTLQEPTAPEPMPTCRHPLDQIVFTGTNGDPSWRCTACEADVTEREYTARALAGGR